MLTSNFKHFILSTISLSLLVVTQSHAAAVLDPTTEPVNVLAPYTTSSSDVGTGSAHAYRPWLENGNWQGDLLEYNISAEGLLSTTVDFTVEPPTTTDPGNWSARIQFAAKASTYWNTRNIIFLNGTQQAFLWGNLTGGQQTALGSSEVLDYIRGDQSKEIDQPSGIYRKRYNLLGDIIHSNPVYVAAPDSSFSLAGYTDFKRNNYADTPSGRADRAARVYVGANDGMVHAFDAASGDEVWAYIPSMIINDLGKLSNSPFSHTYFVDGPLAEGDADFGTAGSPNWRSLLAGSLGSGGKGFFILDITDANLSNDKIRKEIDGSDADMGYIHGKAQIARLPAAHSNKWVTITGNGYGSTTGKAVLYMIDKNGTVTKVATDNTTANGLSAPTLVDVDNDFAVDYGYAGDLQGNMWKFNFTVSPVTATKLYAAGADKPITSAPDIRRHPNGGRLVYFGTGSLLSSTDKSNTTTQSIYGIWDGYTGGSAILTQTLGTDDYVYNIPDDSPDLGDITVPVRTNTNNVIDWATHKGWQVDLNLSGERLVTNPTIRADRVQFVSHNPLDGDRGNAWMLQLNYLNGGTGAGVFLDLNRDQNLDADDKVNSNIPVGVNLGNGSFSGPQIAKVSNTRDTTFINGLYLASHDPLTENTHFQGGHIDVDTDSPNGVTVSATASDSACYYQGDFSGDKVDSSGNRIPPSINSPVSRPGATTSYNGNNPVNNKGLDNSYARTGIDGFGGEVDGHQHEYDVRHNQVYVDMLKIEPVCLQASPVDGNTNPLQRLARITEVGMDYGKKFFAIVANADLSPGSDFHLGSKSWNVVEYQKMIHQKLNAWKAAGSNTSLDPLVADSFAAMMVDADGDTLLHSITTIREAGGNTGQIRHSYDDMAIYNGGLIPTDPSCLVDKPEANINSSNASVTNTGRWRGGSLVTQLIGVDEYLADTTTVVAQVVTDLFRKRVINGEDVVLHVDNGDGTFTDYGGLMAKYRVDNDPTLALFNNPAFLYEMVLYWHFERNGTCYGNTSWNADVRGAVNSSSTVALHQQVALLEYNLEKSQVALAAAIADGDTSETARLQTLVSGLTSKIAERTAALAASSIHNTGIPTPPTDITPEVSPSLGPNFRTGRRTWIDLTP